ncbi:membrane protein, conserved [Thermococcus sp. 4557]|nr:membrane protein, conserved [Thermococcus sp. 4557]
MDFDLFMERYGYKILLGIFGMIILGMFAIIVIWAYVALKYLGLFFGGLIVALVAVRSLVNKRILDAQARVFSKYFYDDRKRR